MRVLPGFAVVLMLAVPVAGMAATPYLVMPGSSVSSSSVSSKKASSVSSVPSPRDKALALINAERKKKNVNALTSNALLQTVAQKYAEDMARRGFYDHVNPEGKTAFDRIKASGYFTPPCKCSVSTAYAENLGHNMTDPAMMVQAWMGSTVHKKNLLGAAYKETGVGFSNGIWVQVFGKLEVKR